jgi:hypothetical protein
MSNELSALLEMGPSPAPQMPAPDSRTPDGPRAAYTKRYANLLTVSEALKLYGGVLKVLAYVLGVVSLFGGFSAADRLSGGAAFMIFVVGIVFAIGLHVTGTLIAAIGESMLALADIGTHTGLVADRTGV